MECSAGGGGSGTTGGGDCTAGAGSSGSGGGFCLFSAGSGSAKSGGSSDCTRSGLSLCQYSAYPVLFSGKQASGGSLVSDCYTGALRAVPLLCGQAGERTAGSTCYAGNIYVFPCHDRKSSGAFSGIVFPAACSAGGMGDDGKL